MLMIIVNYRWIIYGGFIQMKIITDDLFLSILKSYDEEEAKKRVSVC